MAAPGHLQTNSGPVRDVRSSLNAEVSAGRRAIKLAGLMVACKTPQLILNMQREGHMVRMYVRHSVEDYRTWRRAYDGFDAERRGMRVIDDGVYQALDDRNDVTIYHDFKTRKRAESFAASKRLKEVMKDAGVKGKPKIWFVNESKKRGPRRS